MTERLSTREIKEVSTSQGTFIIVPGEALRVNSTLRYANYEPAKYARQIDTQGILTLHKLHPELADRAKGYFLYAPTFINKGSKTQELLASLASGRISPLELALEQRKTETIGTAILLIKAQCEMPPRGIRVEAFELASTESGIDLLQPNHRLARTLVRGYRRGADKTSNLVLAFALSHPNYNQGITTPSQLAKKVEREPFRPWGNQAKKLDLSLLRAGFVDLVQKGKIEEIAEMTALPLDKNDLYSQASYWLYQIAIDIVTYKPDRITHVWPFPLKINEKLYPESEFLPYLAQSFFEFYTQLPEVIPEGKAYNISSIASSMQNFLSFAKAVIENDPSQEVAQIIYGYKNSFQEVLNDFYRNPNLCDRRGSPKPPPGSLPHFQDAIDKARKHGARGKNRLTWSHKTRVKAQRGQI